MIGITQRGTGVFGSGDELVSIGLTAAIADRQLACELCSLSFVTMEL
jgi:hypothetical protein